MKRSPLWSLKELSDQLQNLVKGKLWAQVLVGGFLGIVVGVLMGPSVGWVTHENSNLISSWLSLPGHIFLTLIKMIVVPLIFASIIGGICASGTLDQIKRLGIWIVFYFLGTTTFAIVIGLVTASWIRPGEFVDKEGLKASFGLDHVQSVPAAHLKLGDLPQKIVEILPSNPLNSMVQTEMLQIVVFAIIVGLALLMLKRESAKPLLDLLATVQEVCMTVVRWAMYLAPFAVFGLLTQLTARIGLSSLVGVGVYMGVVVLGLLVLVLFYLCMLFFFAGVKPLFFLRSARDVLLLAFSTSSSAAVMPLSMKTAEEKFGVKSTISQFIVPLGATINMDGTALYQSVAALFLAQIFGVDIGLGGMILIVVTSVGASIGAPAAPGVGIAILSLVLTSVGIPVEGIFLILGVDRIMDMCRTGVNVCGDLTACVLMNHWLGRDQAKSKFTGLKYTEKV